MTYQGFFDTYAVITSEKPANTQYQHRYTECNWETISMNNLKDIKQAVVSYSMHSSFVRELIKI